jgi:hypothetical protein
MAETITAYQIEDIWMIAAQFQHDPPEVTIPDLGDRSVPEHYRDFPPFEVSTGPLTVRTTQPTHPLDGLAEIPKPMVQLIPLSELTGDR